MKKHSRHFFYTTIIIIKWIITDIYALPPATPKKDPHPASNTAGKNRPKDTQIPNKQDIINSIKSGLDKLNLKKNPPPITSAKLPESKEIKEIKSIAPKNIVAIDMTIDVKKNKPIFHLKFQGGIPYYAVFFHNNSWYMALSYPSEISVKNKDLKNIPNLQSIHHFGDSQGFLLKLTMNKKLYPRISFRKEENTITLAFLSSPLDQEQSRDILAKKKLDAPLQIQVPHGRIAQDFYDEDDNTAFWIVTAEPKTATPSYLHERSYPDFTLLESYEGLGVLLYNDDIRTEFSKKIAQIQNPHHHTLSLKMEEQKPTLPQSIFQGFEANKAPARLVLLNQKTLEKSSAISEYIESIWLYIALGKTAEAISIVKRLKEISDDLQLVPAFCILDGLSQLLMGRSTKAEEIFKHLPNDPELKFWKSIMQTISKGNLLSVSQIPNEDFYDANEVIDEKTPSYTKTSKNNDEIYKDLIEHKKQLIILPDPVFNIFLSQILQTGLLNKNLELLIAFTDKDFKPKSMDPVTYIDSYAYYKLSQRVISLHKKNRNIKDLNDFLQFYLNPKISTLARLERLQYLHQEKKIDKNSEFKELETLRFQWRGDLLEYKINTYLANRYIEEKMYQRALPLLRKTLRYFPHNGNQDKLPSKMKEILIAYFKQTPPPPLLQSLSVFQEYGDILPDNQDGDDIMIMATNELIKLKLYQNAQEIMEKYIKDKVKKGNIQNRKNRLILHRALSYYLKNEPEKVFDCLKEIQHPSPELSIKVNLLTSLAHAKMEDTDKALAVLGNSEPELYQQADLQFSEANWDEAAAIYEKILHKKKDEKCLPEEQQKLVINLALCQSLCSNEEELLKIHTQYKDLFKKQKGEAIFNFLTKELVKKGGKGKIDIEQEEKYIKNMSDTFPKDHNIVETYLMEK